VNTRADLATDLIVLLSHGCGERCEAELLDAIREIPTRQRADLLEAAADLLRGTPRLSDVLAPPIDEPESLRRSWTLAARHAVAHTMARPRRELRPWVRVVGALLLVALTLALLSWEASWVLGVGRA
jgi:hypothetical protein